MNFLAVLKQKFEKMHEVDLHQPERKKKQKNLISSIKQKSRRI